ncbi:hypothetical protein [Pseudomonas alabamensis]|uniref:hypothetical protein n=1 Tax=Pseudomonas alabamensis TaxID=3064349 RepID=UPI00119D4CDD
MTDYTLNELVDWMKEEPRLSKWGMIACMNRDKLNDLLLQLYILRFKTGSYLPPITGSIASATENRFALNAFTLDWPRLSFENIDLNDSRARLRMNVVGGTQLGLRRISGDWVIREIRDTSPLQGPELSLTLRLAEVPGTVGEEGRVRLDLKFSDDFVMTLSDVPTEQRLVGEFFKEKFAALPDEQRVFELGHIQTSDNPMFQPESFALRTQARRRTADDMDGAVLAFVRWQGDREGDFPGAHSDFRYLLPKDTEHTATVLVDPRRVMVTQLIETVTNNLAKDATFETLWDDEGRMVRVKATAGHVLIPTHLVTREFDVMMGNWTRVMRLGVAVREMHFQLEDDFSISIGAQTADIHWTIRGTLVVKVYDLDDTGGRFRQELNRMGFDLTEFMQDVSDTFEYRLSASYQLEDVEEGQLNLLSFNFQEVMAPRPVLPAIKPPSDLPDYPEHPDYWWYVMYESTMGPLVEQFGSVVQGVISIIGGFDTPSLELILREQLEKDFITSSPVREVVKDIVSLNFNNTILVDKLRAPKDIGAFGRISPTLTSFVISPLEHTLVAGASKQFDTTPTRLGLQWSVEPILATQSSGQVGTIDESTGLYTAPAADTFEGPFIRVRVNALDPANNFSSSALITVLKSALQVNPLAYVIHASGPVNLQAGYLGQPSDLRWTLKDSTQGGRLEGNGATALYTAPARLPPSDPDNPYDPGLAYMVDEVQLSDVAGSSVQTALLIVESAYKLPMAIKRVVNPAAGTVQLVAFPNGIEKPPTEIVWSVRYGSGSIDPATGIYTHDPASRDGFALIGATYKSNQVGIYEGYVLQTLPPAALEDAVQGVGAFEVQSVEERTAS